MRLPKEYNILMSSHAAHLSNKKAAKWLRKNIPAINAVICYKTYQEAKEENINCSYFTEYPDEVENNRNILLTPYNRGYNTDINIETVFHEYGHYLYSVVDSIGGYRDILANEIMEFYSMLVEGKSYPIGYLPVIMQDAIGMIYQIKVPRGHEIGYSDDNLETEAFAEFLASVLMEDTKLEIFAKYCPISYKILSKQVNNLF